jgi:hypothetical protein
MARFTLSPPTSPPPYVRRKTRALGWEAEGEGEMSFNGYWNVMVERAEMRSGSNCTTSRPSPGAENDWGKGESMETPLM